MKRILALIILCSCLISGLYGQKHAISIPALANTNPRDIYPVKSLLATYSEQFDLLVSLRSFSTWEYFDQRKKVLAHKENGWYRIEILSGYIFRDTTLTTIRIIKIPDARGDSILNILVSNHLFDMEDERTKKDNTCKSVIFDAGEYEFEILAKDKYKKLYAYTPQFFEERCPGNIERKQFIRCIDLFMGFPKW